MISQYLGVDSDYIIIGLVVTVIILLILTIINTVQMSKLKKTYQSFMTGKSGKNLEETISSMTMVVEGARTCVSAYRASKELNIDTPIIDAVYEVIYLHIPVNVAIKKLMSRALKDED